MEDALDKKFENLGITYEQRKTGVYNSLKEVIKEHPEALLSIICGDLDSAIIQAVHLTEELKTRTSDALMRYISDTDLKNAVACFNSTLTITQDVFGEENMTEAVICKAIEAGSYIAYRAIMGEAQQPVKRY